MTPQPLAWLLHSLPPILHKPNHHWRECFTVSHLSYTSRTKHQYQTI